VKVAYYSPLPPERSGVADYSALLLPELRRRVEVVVVRRGRRRPVPADVALYHVGNDPETHGWIVDALLRRPGVVVLHDFVLHHLVAGLTLGRKDGPAYLAAMEREAGVPGRLLAHGVLEGRVPPPWETRPDEFPLAGDVLAAATGLIVHSRFVEERVWAAGFRGPVWRIPHPAWRMDDVAAATVAGRPVFGCFGHLNPSKRIPQLLEAFALVRARQPDARLLLVGPAAPGFDVAPHLGDGVERIDYVPEEELWSLLAACDACVSLRSPTMGETSGIAIRALALGRPLVVSDVGWFSELPDDVALRVPVGDDEVPALAASLELLATSEATQQTMSEAASAYAEREHDLVRVAEAYTAALEEAAGGGGVAAAVLDEVALAAADVGIEPGTASERELAGRLAELGLDRDGKPEPQPPPPPGVLAGVPAWAWLALLVLASIGVRAWLSTRVVAPWIMVDELIYSELAKSFAATGHFLIRGARHGSYGFVYPALIAPAWKAFASVPTAYAWAKGIGVVAMSLTAIPAYVLARRVIAPLPALAAAVLAVAVPSMLYTGTLMTETVFYPLFVCVALALVLALERPTATRQLVLLGVALVAYLTRAQAVALLPAIATAPLLVSLVDRRPGLVRTVRTYRVLYGTLAAAVVAVVVVESARGHSPYDVFGSYSVTGHQHYQVGNVLHWLLYHVAELDLYLGVLPFAALVLLASTLRRLDRPARLFVVAAVSLSAWLILEVAAFASTYVTPARVEERNMFYVAPLFLIALLLWIERGLPRVGRAPAVAAVVAAALPAVLPYERLIDTPATSDTLALIPLWWLQEGTTTVTHLAGVVVAAAAILALAFLLVGPRVAYVLPLVVLAWFSFTTERLEDFRNGFPHTSLATLYQGISADHRDWVDRAVGRDATVSFVWAGANQNEAVQLWENEFFNRSVERVYYLRSPSPGDLPETRAQELPDGTLVAGGRPLVSPYVLTDVGSHLAGQVVARDELNGIVLLRTPGPVHLAYRVSGVNPLDLWSGPTATYTRFHCSGGTLRVSLASDTRLFLRPQTVTAAGRSITFEPSQKPTFAVPLRPGAEGRCRVVFHVSPTAVPALVEPGSSDTRRLGVYFLSFSFSGA
jgi:glycosyltransferase involved in cell wall biosynthesis